MKSLIVIPSDADRSPFSRGQKLRASALRDLDLTRLRPRFIFIEVRDRAAIDTHFATHDYEHVADIGPQDLLYRAHA